MMVSHYHTVTMSLSVATCYRRMQVKSLSGRRDFETFRKLVISAISEKVKLLSDASARDMDWLGCIQKVNE